MIVKSIIYKRNKWRTLKHDTVEVTIVKNNKFFFLIYPIKPSANNILAKT